MLYSISRPKRSTCFILFLLTGSLAFFGCGSSSPEGVGKKLANLKCELDDKRDEMEHDMDTKLAAELKNNTITTPDQLNKRKEELRRPIRALDSTYRANGKDMMEKIELDFPKEDDRHTIANAAEATEKVCTREREERNKDREEIKLSELEMKVYPKN